MLAEMDMDLFQYWVAYLHRRDRNHTITDYQLAYLAKIISEMFSKGSGKPLTEYLIKFQTEEERLEEQEELNRKFMESLKRIPGMKTTVHKAE